MPTPRLITSYKRDYIELFEAAASKEVRITLDSKEDALRLRRYLYAVRQSLLDQPTVFPIAALLSPLVSLVIADNVLIAGPREDAAPAIKEALDDSARQLPGDAA